MNAPESQRFTAGIFIVLRALFVLAAIALLAAMLLIVIRYALPLLIACMLAFLINPVVLFIEKKTGLPRGASSFVVLFTSFSLAVGMLLFLSMILIRGISSLSHSVPDDMHALIGDLQTFFFSNLLPSWERAMHLFSILPDGQQKVIRLNLENMAGTLVAMLNDLAGQLLTNLSQLIAAIPNTLITALFIFLASFFLSKDAEQIKARFHEACNRSPIIKTVDNVLIELKKTCVGFVKAQIQLVCLTTLLIYVGLLILRVSHPLTVALVTGAIDLIPYLGTGVVFIPWILYQTFIHHYFFAICLTSLYSATIIQRQLMEPKILSINIGIDPLASLISIYFGFRWLGLTGIVIGPLFLVVIKTLHHSGALRSVWHYILGQKPNS